MEELVLHPSGPALPHEQQWRGHKDIIPLRGTGTAGNLMAKRQWFCSWSHFPEHVTLRPRAQLCWLMSTAGLQQRKERRGGAGTPASRETSKSSEIYKVAAIPDVLPPLCTLSLCSQPGDAHGGVMGYSSKIPDEAISSAAASCCEHSGAAISNTEPH